MTVNNGTVRTHDHQRLESVSRSLRLLVLSLVITFVAFIVWAAFSPLDMVSIASGTVEPASKVQTVQHLEGGIVQDILVSEGEAVHQGQALVEMESISSGASYGEMLVRVTTLNAAYARLQAETNDASDISFDAKFAQANPQLVERTSALFHARRKQLSSTLAAQEEEINVRKQAIREIETRIKFSTKRLVLVQEQNQIEQELVSSSLSNRYEHLENLKEVNRLESEIAESKASLAKAKASLSQGQRQLENIKTKYYEEVRTALQETRSQLDEAKQRIEKYKDSLARTVLRAPMDGIVKNLYVVTKGGVVAPGGTVVDIVPEKEGLIVEAKLPPQDIGHVRVGQSVFVQLASSEATHYGRLEGSVASISPDSITTEDGEVFYVVRVDVEQNEFHQGKNRYKLSPGLLVTAGIVTGQRSVLEYLLSPFLEYMPFALSER